MAGGMMREIKRRITSINNTHQITKAMEMVSSSKFRKFQKLVQESRPYHQGVEGILTNIASGVQSVKHPLLDGKDEVKKVGIVVIASDRGLCGAFNNNAFKKLRNFIDEQEKDNKKVSVIAVGKKTRDYCKKREIDIKGEYIQLITEQMFDKAKEISEQIVDFFYEDIFDEVYILYSEFISAISSQVKIKKMMPVERKESDSNETYLFEPSEEIILTSLLPKYLNIEIYQAILESSASEHSARMTAMKSASDNALDIIDDLTLSYNRARQAAITQEISEIVGGANAIG